MAKVKNKKKKFETVYAQLQTVNDVAVLFGKKGEPSVFFEIVNPIEQNCTDADLYSGYHVFLDNLVKTIGEGYCIQKQDIFAKKRFRKDVPDDAEFLTKSYFRYFEGREYVDTRTYLIVTQAPQKGAFVSYDPKKWKEFFVKTNKIKEYFKENGVPCHMMDQAEINEYVHRFMAFDFADREFAMTNFMASEEFLRVGQRCVKSFQLVDIDHVDLPMAMEPYSLSVVNGRAIAEDVFSFLPEVPQSDCVVYNQVLQIPSQRATLQKLTGKSKRHASMPDPSNAIAKAAIDAVLERLAVDSTLIVNANFNILVSCPFEKAQEVESYLEAKMFERGIMPSKTAFNQLELFRSSFPGAGYTFNRDYDLFQTLADAALCLFYKERSKRSEETPLKTYYTDRRGLPICIDITGKEGENKYTDNANFFCIGPSGSGKSFHMNSVVRQLLEQGTDVVMVDTGDSYEGICGYFSGRYISYTKENPISMNPFKVTDIEYRENFGEKKNFLKSLIFLIYKGNVPATKIEDVIINQTLVEYYDHHFHPFEKFTEEERESLRQKLLIAAEMEDSFDNREKNMQDIEDEIRKEEDFEVPAGLIRAADERKMKLLRNCRQFYAIIKDASAEEAEKQTAREKLEIYKKQLLENTALAKIEKQIDLMEQQKRQLKVDGLSFNTYYEFALRRIPQICKQEKIDFNINKFASICKPFYRGGELADTLNSEIDANLFDERFIVFEIDKIKDDPVIFPIVVLIIMDVFLQKMRIKKGRKALIIEEAWKAIASPTMAEYIKYLYKTVRKFHGIAGVVTQELNDVIDSPIVKEAIINNSDVKILLDQTKFKDRYADISAILGLTEVQKQQIFTINSLQNKEGRNYFKEVWICRGQYSDVYGVEEPPECYWAYTTERVEKEAVRLYRRHYGNVQSAIEHLEADRKRLGIKSYLDLARKINEKNAVL